MTPLIALLRTQDGMPQVRAHMDQPWVMWSGALKEWRRPPADDELMQLSSSTECVVVGQEKPGGMEWSEYFILGLGIPAIWRTEILIHFMRDVKQVEPSAKYRAYMYALQLRPQQIAIISESTCFGVAGLAAIEKVTAKVELSHILPMVLSGGQKERAQYPSYPEVTIVICTFNEEQRIGWALQSVFAQTGNHFECIISDDGSTDRTIDRVRMIDDPRLRITSLPSNRGKAHALNAALRIARGKYLLELDADDWLPPHAVTTLFEAMDCEASDVGLLTSFYHLWRRNRYDDLIYRGIQESQQITVSNHFAKVPIPRLYRTDVLREFEGWDVHDSSRGRLYEDVAMTARFLKQSKIAMVKQALYHRVIRHSSISQQHDHEYTVWARENLDGGDD